MYRNLSWLILKIHKIINQKSAFSLLEVIIAIGILTTVIVAALQLTILTIRNLTVREHNLYATYYAEELYNFLNSEREVDWAAFADKSTVSGGSSTTYCANTLNPLADMTITINDILFNGSYPTNPKLSDNYRGACLHFQGIVNGPGDRIFKREVTLTSLIPPGSTPSQIQVDLDVTWVDYGQEYHVPLQSLFTVHD